MHTLKESDKHTEESLSDSDGEEPLFLRVASSFQSRLRSLSRQNTCTLNHEGVHAIQESENERSSEESDELRESQPPIQIDKTAIRASHTRKQSKPKSRKSDLISLSFGLARSPTLRKGGTNVGLNLKLRNQMTTNTVSQQLTPRSNEKPV